jgi:hypothetical protein
MMVVAMATTVIVWFGVGFVWGIAFGQKIEREERRRDDCNGDNGNSNERTGRED